MTKIYKPPLDVEAYRRRSFEPRHLGLLGFSAFARKGITAILGNEGSGKSTLLRMTAALMVPDDGRITFRLNQEEELVWSCGSAENPEIDRLKERISYTPHLRRLNQETLLEESLLLIAQMRRVPYPRRRCSELIAKWGLAGFRKTPIQQLQSGVLKRYLIVRGLLSNPAIWLLDEPTLGMDRIGKRLLWEELKLRGSERITLLVTQDLELAECANDLMLMESGSCRRFGQRKFLTASVPEGTVASWYRTMQTFSRLQGPVARHTLY